MAADSDWMKNGADILAIMNTAMELKKRMLKKGLRKAKCLCPLCKNETFLAILAGSKNHIHAKCQTEGCSAQIMQ
jgi:hypothetical protein